MSSLATSGILFACIFGGGLFGMLLRGRLSDAYLCAESKDVIKVSVGLIGTMSALVLGLLVASAKSAYDTQRNGLAQLAGNVILLDRTLAFYGKETQETREQLRASIVDMLEQTWPEESNLSSSRSATEGRYEGIFEKLQGLTPTNDSQRRLQAQALKIATDLAQTRWQMFAQRDSSIPTPFLVLMVSWLALTFASFGLLAPRNAVAVSAVTTSALVVASSIFLVLELNRPFDGIIKVSSVPIRDALAQLGR